MNPAVLTTEVVAYVMFDYFMFVFPKLKKFILRIRMNTNDISYILHFCASIHGLSLGYYELLFLRQVYYPALRLFTIALFVMR